MVINETQTRQEQLLLVAQAMMTAARTAPKSKGVDNLEIMTITGDDLLRIAIKMREVSAETGFKFFLRDANNVEQADVMVFIGTKLQVFGMNCGFCGFDTCAEKLVVPTVPCAFNINDLGIALGSAVSVAADLRVDSRVMYSAARGAMDLGFAADCVAGFAILLSCSGKSPFFDRAVAKV